MICFLWLIIQYHGQGELGRKRFTWDYSTGLENTFDDSHLPGRCLKQHKTLQVCPSLSLASFKLPVFSCWTLTLVTLCRPHHLLKASILNIIDWISILSMHHNGDSIPTCFTLLFQYRRANVHLGGRHITLALSFSWRFPMVPWKG